MNIEQQHIDSAIAQIPSQIMNQFASMQSFAMNTNNEMMLKSMRNCSLQLKESMRPLLLDCVHQHRGFETIRWPDDDDGDTQKGSVSMRFMRFLMTRTDRLVKQQHLYVIAIIACELRLSRCRPT